MTSKFLIWCAVAAALAQAPPRDPLPRLTGTGIISGRIVDANTGRPLRRATVSLGDGDARSISSNSQGAFEFRELPPARYTLRVTRDSYLDAHYGQRHFSEPGRPIELSAGQRFTDIVIRMLKKSIISGYITDDGGDPIADVDVLPMQFKYFQGRRRFVLAGNGIATDSTGYFRISGLAPGAYQLLAVTRQTWTIEEDGVPYVLGYAPTYYPAQPAGGEVQSIRVQPGQDVTNVSLALSQGRHVTITGTAVDSQGVPLGGQAVQPLHYLRGPTRIVSMSLPSVPIEEDGSFIIRNVPPGEYVLHVAVVRTTRFHSDEPLTPQPLKAAERSRVRVNIIGSDLHGVVIATSPTATASGRVEWDDGVGLPESLQFVRVGAQPADDVDPDVHAKPDSGRVRDDGTFEVGPLLGKYRFGTSPLPDTWIVKAVLHGLDDVSVLPIEISGLNPVTGLRVILSQTAAAVTGTISDANAKPGGGTVLLFSTDRDHWFEYSRFVRHARADQNGRVVIRALLPGEYYAVAVPFIEEDQWHDPEYLDALRRTAVRITLAEREEREMAFVVKQEAAGRN